MSGGVPPRVEGIDREHQIGEVITGRVAVAQADRVTLTLAFETAGSCDPERAVLREVELGPCSGSVPFRIDGPRWPPTYRGTLFAGCWYLEVTAFAGGRREVARSEIVLAAPGGDLHVRPANDGSTPRPRSSGRWGRLSVLGSLLAVCVALVVIGVIAGSGIWVVGLVAGVMLLFPTIGTILGILSFQAAGNLAVDIRPQVGSLVVDARLDDDESVASVAATLVVRELAQRGRATDHPESREWVVHQHEVALVADGAGRYVGTMPTTAEAVLPATMSHSTAQVGWSLHVRVALRGAPDLERTLVLVARPSTGPGAEVQPRWTTG